MTVGTLCELCPIEATTKCPNCGAGFCGSGDCLEWHLIDCGTCPSCRGSGRCNYGSMTLTCDNCGGTGAEQ